jgi:LysR family transcriptional activator of nhaA
LPSEKSFILALHFGKTDALDRMRHLNYNHLLYFWSVVREGGVAAAARSLHVTPQTISGQIKLLEDQLGGALFEKQGRRLAPTDLGKLTYGYADEIFSRGLELASVLRGALPRGLRSVTIGVSDVVPKLVTWRVLAPLLEAGADGARPFRVVCHEGSLDSLLADLAVHRLDLVLSASPAPAESGLKVFNHLLGESELAFFAAPRLAARLRTPFPQCLERAPLLMPTDRSASRRALESWFEARGITPTIVGEFDDSALIKTLGQHGVGVFVAPVAIAPELTQEKGVREIGRAPELRARFYAISTERRIKHPAVAMISTVARNALFNVMPGVMPGATPVSMTGMATGAEAPATPAAPSPRRPARPAR